MRLAVSNIAWEPSADAAVAAVLREHDVDAVEVAPSRAFENPATATVLDAYRYRDHWRSLGLEIVAVQSLLFARPDLAIFRGSEARRAARDHLAHVLRLAGAMGARACVFGSPGNRRRDGMPVADADRIAVDLFGDLAEVASAAGTALVLEANPEVYGADYLTTASEAAAIVHAVDHPGLGLHLDTACMYLAGDDAERIISEHRDVLTHVHASEPQLAPLGPRGAAGHDTVAAALRRIGYDGCVSVEMRPTSEPVRQVRTAAAFATGVYR